MATFARRGRFIVSVELLLDVLHLPADTIITNVRPADSSAGGIEFQVVHPDLPIVREGAEMPLLSPQIGQMGGPHFIGWGVPPPVDGESPIVAARRVMDGWDAAERARQAAFGSPSVVHLSFKPFVAECGANVPNQRSTDNCNHVTCPACRKFIDTAEDGGLPVPPTLAKQLKEMFALAEPEADAPTVVEGS